MLEEKPKIALTCMNAAVHKVCCMHVAQINACLMLAKVLYYLNDKLETGFAFQLGESQSGAWCKG